MFDPIVIVGAARTPMGGFQGDFTGATASDLGGVAIKAALDRAGVDKNDVDEVLMGCVLPAGQGAGPRASSPTQSRPWLERASNYAEQDVRIRHENSNECRRSVKSWQRISRCRRRHGKHDKRPPHPTHDAKRATDWAWRSQGPYVSGWAGRRL